MKSTYYLEIDREIFVKLTNFKEKGNELIFCKYLFSLFRKKEVIDKF